MHIESRARHQDQIPLRLSDIRCVRRKVCLQAWIVVHDHVQAVVRDGAEFRSIDDSVSLGDRRSLIASAGSGCEFCVAMMSDGFGVEHIKAGCASGDIDTFAIVGNRQGMQFIVLSILEISCFAIAISHAAEIRESTIPKEPGGVRPYIGWRTADLLKTET